MGVAGTEAGRRWSCSQCGVTVLRRGRGYARRTKLYAVPSVSPEYIEDLINLSDELSRIMRQHKGQAFNVNVRNLNRAIKFFAVNDEADNQRAITKEIKQGSATIEEIGEAVPLPLPHIRAICNQLVNAKCSAYEWRPIGYNAHHGRRVFGIFRKDAPTLIRGHSTAQPLHRPSLYYQDMLDAADDLHTTIQRHEKQLFGKPTPLPWESPAEAKHRAALQRSGGNALN
jgi:hypothetical protein